MKRNILGLVVVAVFILIIMSAFWTNEPEEVEAKKIDTEALFIKAKTMKEGEFANFSQEELKKLRWYVNREIENANYHLPTYQKHLTTFGKLQSGVENLETAEDEEPLNKLEKYKLHLIDNNEEERKKEKDRKYIVVIGIGEIFDPEETEEGHTFGRYSKKGDFFFYEEIHPNSKVVFYDEWAGVRWPYKCMVVRKYQYFILGYENLSVDKYSPDYKPDPLRNEYHFAEASQIFNTGKDISDKVAFVGWGNLMWTPRRDPGLEVLATPNPNNVTWVAFTTKHPEKYWNKSTHLLEKHLVVNRLVDVAKETKDAKLANFVRRYADEMMAKAKEGIESCNNDLPDLERIKSNVGKYYKDEEEAKQENLNGNLPQGDHFEVGLRSKF